MTLNKIFTFFAKNGLVLLAIAMIFSCASIQRPTGGPRDRTPPKLLKATPANPTRNFNAKVIQLDFDEYFKLNNQFQEITITPNMEKTPEFSIKQKSLVIKLKDTLQKNTTYVINFGKAIADVNEGNILKNFTYVFSTGPKIDSLSISGTVTNTQTQLKEKDVTVMIFPVKQDSILFGKKRPAIFTTTDTAGNFKLSNLHDGDYTVYALKESNPNRIYDNDEELIGFATKPVHLTRDTAGIQLLLFKQNPPKFRAIERKIDADGKLLFTFNRGLNKPDVHIAEQAIDEQKIVDFNKTADTAMIYLRNMNFDSVHVSFSDNNKVLDTIVLRKGRKETFKRKLDLKYNISGEALKPGSNLMITANYPVDAVDVSRITMTEDSVNVSDFTFQRDTVNSKKFTVGYRWKSERRYEVAFNEGTFTSIYGDKNPRLVKRFSLDKPDNYGTLTLKVHVPDTGHYLVKLLTPDNMEVRSDEITKTTSIVYRNFYAAKYRVKVIYDDNANGKWDTGNLKPKKQPENIWISNRDIILRPNFDEEEPIDIPKEIRHP